MVRPSKPSFLPLAILFVVFVIALFAIHANVTSLVGREIADLAVLVSFFGGLFLWTSR